VTFTNGGPLRKIEKLELVGNTQGARRKKTIYWKACKGTYAGWIDCEEEANEGGRAEGPGRGLTHRHADRLNRLGGPKKERRKGSSIFPGTGSWLF